MNNSCEKQHFKDDSYIHVQNRTCLSKINQEKKKPTSTWAKLMKSQFLNLGMLPVFMIRHVQ